MSSFCVQSLLPTTFTSYTLEAFFMCRGNFPCYAAVRVTQIFLHCSRSIFDCKSTTFSTERLLLFHNLLINYNCLDFKLFYNSFFKHHYTTYRRRRVQTKPAWITVQCIQAVSSTHFQCGIYRPYINNKRWWDTAQYFNAEFLNQMLFNAIFLHFWYHLVK